MTAIKAWQVPTAAAAVLVFLAIDVARALEAGIADSGLAFFAPSASLGVAVALAVGRRPERRRIALLILLWIFVGVLSDVDWDWQSSRLAATVAVFSFGLQGPIYAHLLLAYPSGSVRDRRDRFCLVAAYVLGLTWIGFPLLFADPRSCGQGCLPRVPSLLFTGFSFDLRPVGQVFDVVLAAFGVILVGLFARRVRNTPAGARRTQLPLFIGGLYAVGVFTVARIADLGRFAGMLGLLDWLDRLNSLLIPLAILAGIAMINAQRGLVGNLVVKLATAPAGGVRDALAESLGDPTLELALWVRGRQAFVDEAGSEVDPVPAPGRAVTLVGPSSEPLAALTHDESLLGQRTLIEAAGSAATLALENTRLQAELRAQVAELRASRTRIVTAADAERRRLERDLHDGAQQRLLAVGLALQLLDRQDTEGRGLLREAEAELQQALSELRTLARGIHPAVLTEQGLAGGVRSLADRAPCTVKLDLDDDHRHTPAVEAAAYFVISEALANTAKHAGATQAHITVRNHDSHLFVEISDNGNGGASLTRGGGLEGLGDRVGALNGNLTIQSSPEQGTTVRAEIPCAPS